MVSAQAQTAVQVCRPCLFPRFRFPLSWCKKRFPSGLLVESTTNITALQIGVHVHFAFREGQFWVTALVVPGQVGPCSSDSVLRCDELHPDIESQVLVHKMCANAPRFVQVGHLICVLLPSLSRLR